MLLFRLEEDVAAWCVATGEPHGETLPLAQVWETFVRVVRRPNGP